MNIDKPGAVLRLTSFRHYGEDGKTYAVLDANPRGSKNRKVFLTLLLGMDSLKDPKATDADIKGLLTQLGWAPQNEIAAALEEVCPEHADAVFAALNAQVRKRRDP